MKVLTVPRNSVQHNPVIKNTKRVHSLDGRELEGLPYVKRRRKSLICVQGNEIYVL